MTLEEVVRNTVNELEERLRHRFAGCSDIPTEYFPQHVLSAVQLLASMFDDGEHLCFGGVQHILDVEVCEVYQVLVEQIDEQDILTFATLLRELGESRRETLHHELLAA